MPHVSLLIPARNSEHALEHTVSEAHRYLSERYPDDFEMILIPGGSDRSVELADSLSRRYTHVISQPHDRPIGKGAALKNGFSRARGEWVFFTDADLPYELDFFDEAAKKLRSGFDLITGNRRLPESLFNIPVELLPVAYKRHRLGLLFNRVVRLLLPIPTTDTQAGIKAMSRRLADEAFSKAECPGFFFDLEFFLSARGRGFAHTELPVSLRLNTEKSTVRVLRESVQAALWLSRITLSNLLGRYGKPVKPESPLRHYRGVSLGTRLFLMLRWWLTPYRVMADHLPRRGRILDMGCGHGLLSFTIAAGSADRSVLGVDHDEARVREAQTAARSSQLPVTFSTGSLHHPPSGPFDGITLIDVMHYFDPPAQEAILKWAFENTAPGGVVLVREVNPEGGLISRLNRLYEKLATGIGFTRSEKKTELHFRSPEGWIAAMESAGFRVRSERCSSALFADVLYRGDKPAGLDGEKP